MVDPKDVTVELSNWAKTRFFGTQEETNLFCKEWDSTRFAILHDLREKQRKARTMTSSGRRYDG